MADEIFDPEIHATDPKTGEPSLNKDGSFRKKRRDAGGKKITAPKAAAGSPSKNATREKYRKNVDQVLGVPVTLLSIKDPVLGYACGELAPLWSAGLADLAMDYPQLAAALEKSGNLGSAAGLLGAALLTGVQIGHLVGKVPAHLAKTMGARTREEIEQLLEARGIELAAQAEQEKKWDAEDAQASEDIQRMMDDHQARQHVPV